MTDTEHDQSLSVRRKRLRYRAWHRGTLEMDQVMGRFADAHVEALSQDDLDRLEQLMAHEDADLYSWIIGQTPVPGGIDTELLERIAKFHKGPAEQ